MNKLIGLIVLIALVAVSCQTSKTEDGSEKVVITGETIEEKVESLLSQMTMEEKAGQMTQVAIEYVKEDADIGKYGIGSLLSGGNSKPETNTPQAWLDLYNKYQKSAMASRTGIPMIYGIDAVHGHNNVYGATIFPHNIGLGATHNPNLIEAISQATALEVVATGIDWTFAPCLTTPQEYRWGRTYEGFSSDYQEVTPLGVAAVKGYQGKDLSSPTTVLACAKHFVGDGNTIFGTGLDSLVDRGDSRISLEETRERLLPQFQAAIDADVKTIMASYNSWNGEKCHGVKQLLTDILKDEMGFKGFVVSDWAGIDEIPGDAASDIITSINAGMDMVMLPGFTITYPQFIQYVTEAVKQGDISQERIDDAVRRILTVKFEMGIFENPMKTNQYFDKIGCQEHRDIGRDAVRQSAVVLKNESVLPISAETKTIILAGRGADNLGMQCGGWSVTWQGDHGPITKGTTILEALKAQAPEGMEIIHDSLANTQKGDIAIVVIGEDPYAEMKGDRRSLDLSAEDLQVIENAKNQGMKVVVCLLSGRPMNVAKHLNSWDGFVALWLPGTEGDGVADVLYGAHNPNGRLSFPWPRVAEEGAQSEDLLFAKGAGLSF